MSNLVPMPNVPTMKQRIARRNSAMPPATVAFLGFCAGLILGLVFGVVIGVAW